VIGWTGSQDSEAFWNDVSSIKIVGRALKEVKEWKERKEGKTDSRGWRPCCLKEWDDGGALR